MSVHPKFAIGGEEALALASRAGFGTLIAHDGAAPVAVHLPFLVTSHAAGNLRIGGRRQLGQHKGDAGHGAIVGALDEASDPKARAISDMMRALRPGLDYGGEAG